MIADDVARDATAQAKGVALWETEGWALSWAGV